MGWKYSHASGKWFWRVQMKRHSRHPHPGVHYILFPFYTRVLVAFGSLHPGLPFYRSLRELPIYTVHPGAPGPPNPRSGCGNGRPGWNPGAQRVNDISNPWKGWDILTYQGNGFCGSDVTRFLSPPTGGSFTPGSPFAPGFWSPTAPGTRGYHSIAPFGSFQFTMFIPGSRVLQTRGAGAGMVGRGGTPVLKASTIHRTPIRGGNILLFQGKLLWCSALSV